MILNRLADMSAYLVLALSAGCATSRAAPPAPLSQQAVLGSWDLTHVGSRRVRLAMALEFRPDGISKGSVRCNGWQARYQVLAHRVAFPDDVIITAAGCHPRYGTNGRDIAERASDTFFHPEVMYLSPDRRFLYVRGKEFLRFERVSPASRRS